MSVKINIVANAIIVTNWAIIGFVTMAMVAHFSDSAARLQTFSVVFHIFEKLANIDKEGIDLIKYSIDVLEIYQNALKYERMYASGEMMFHMFLNVLLTIAVRRSSLRLVLAWTGLCSVAFVCHAVYFCRHIDLTTTDLGLVSMEFAGVIWMAVSCLGILFYALKLSNTTKKHKKSIPDMKV